MSHGDQEIIVAQATPVGIRAPLAILRVSGPGCHDILEKYFSGHSRKSQQSWQAQYGNWVDEQGVVDDVIITPYKNPNSYTGQDMFEVSCHGNPVFVEAITETIIRSGGRVAKPGEFTLRAVLNGKMDLLNAEAIHGMIEATTRYHSDLLRRQSAGPINDLVNAHVETILQIQAHIEATIDYGEEDIDALEKERLLERLVDLLAEVDKLIKTSSFTTSMRRGFAVLITGKPNVGKSSLFNRLVKQERAIVTGLPGTTRDLISEEINVGGLPIVLYDSAGIRLTDDQVEHIGIGKIYELLTEIDLVIHLTDTNSDESIPEYLETLPIDKLIFVQTKMDLLGKISNGKIGVSNQTLEGLKQLEDEIVIRLSSGVKGQTAFLVNQRQEQIMKSVAQILQDALEQYQLGYGEEVLSSYLNKIRNLFGELTGETTTEDILDRMFSNFCLGK